MTPGVAGAVGWVTTSVCAEEVPQLLPAVTETVPPTDPAVAMMVSRVEVPVHPLGSDHVYVVAPLTAATEKVSKLPLHADVGPLIAPGVEGTALTVTASVWGAELPQVLLAVTDTVPLEPAVAEIAV